MVSFSDLPNEILTHIVVFAGSCDVALVCKPLRDRVAANLHQILATRFSGRLDYTLKLALENRRYILATEICEAMTSPFQISRGLLQVSLKGTSAMAAILLAKEGCSPSYENGMPLMNAAAVGNTGVLSLLLSQPGVRADVRDSRALHNAVLGDNIEATHILLTASPPAAANGQHGGILDQAVRHRNHVMVELLLSAQVPALADYGDSRALVSASDIGAVRVVDLLMNTPQHAARADCNNGGAIIAASRRGHSGIVERLLNAPQNAARADSRDGFALVVAAEKGHDQVVELLLSAPENAVCADSEAGERAFLAAAKNGHSSVVEKLLYQPSHPTPRDTYKGLVLEEASARGYTDVVRLILQAPRPHGFFFRPTGYNPFYGNKSVYKAAKNGHIEVVRLLLCSDVVGDLDTGAAMAIASDNGHNLIASVIREFGRGNAPRLLGSRMRE